MLPSETVSAMLVPNARPRDHAALREVWGCSAHLDSASFGELWGQPTHRSHSQRQHVARLIAIQRGALSASLRQLLPAKATLDFAPALEGGAPHSVQQALRSLGAKC